MEASTLSSPTPKLLDKVRSYWRLRLTFFVLFGLGALLTIAIALKWPPTYRAAATILIEQQEIPQDLVRSAITSFADQRVQIISQRVMTTQNLMSLIDRYNLYPDIRESKPREVLLQKMRSDIALKMISADVIDPRSGRPTQATIAFHGVLSESLARPDPEGGERAHDLVSERESHVPHPDGGADHGFLRRGDRQAGGAHPRNSTRSSPSTRRSTRTASPISPSSTSRSSDRTELELHDAENRIAALDSQEVLLRAQLAQLNPTSQVFSDTGQRVMGVDDRLKALRSQLADYKARYAPDHPDVSAPSGRSPGSKRSRRPSIRRCATRRRAIPLVGSRRRGRNSRARRRNTAPIIRMSCA